MTFRRTLVDLTKLTDDALLTHLRDTIAAVQARQPLKPVLRHVLAETLAEEKAEMLAGSDLSPERIAALSHVDPDLILEMPQVAQ